MLFNTLFTPYTLGSIILKNRIVMAPMTRSRAINNVPNALMAQYYGQRATAGLIITEGTSPSPNGTGYSRIPGIYSAEQIQGWRQVTDAVHAKEGKVFLQIMHTGRIGHTLNLPKGGRVLAPSAIKAAGQMFTDEQGMQDYPVPNAMTAEEVVIAKTEFVHAATNAIDAGFDGVELHGANGYLLEQFLSPITNQRTDDYGGSIANRIRFVLDVAEEVSNAIGANKTGIRLSPYGVASDMPHYPEINDTYAALAKSLDKIGIAYVHLVDHSSMGSPQVPHDIKQNIRSLFSNTLILSGGYNAEKANDDIQGGAADLIAFGRPFINNPDLVQRIANDKPWATNLDANTFYTPGEKGYTDYPTVDSE